jgi:hypothetical protein
MSFEQFLVCLFFGAIVYGIGFWRGITSGLRQVLGGIEKENNPWKK